MIWIFDRMLVDQLLRGQSIEVPFRKHDIQPKLGKREWVRGSDRPSGSEPEVEVLVKDWREDKEENRIRFTLQPVPVKKAKEVTP